MSRAHRGYVKHAALFFAAAFITLPAFAATDVVTNLSDSGVSGDGSLRGEILAAAAGDTIVFAPGLTGTVTLLTGTASLKFSGNCGLIIAKNLTISGPGASILAVSGNHDGAVGSVFCVGAVAAISGLTIENGKAGSTGFGGGINAAGGSTLTVTNSVISGNGAGSGGGINNGGTGTVTNTTISSNNGVTGGGIFNGGILTVINSTFSGNTASGFGGGIFNGGDLTMTNSTISGNSAADAGGIYNANPATLKSTIVANTKLGGNCIGDANEELQSCCACLVTPNGLASLSAQALTATSLTGEKPTSLVVKLLAWSTTAGASSTAPPGTPAPPTSSSCNPAMPGAISGGMHAWGTTVHALPVGGPSTYTVTETEFSPAALSAAEYAHITQSCEFNQINGSGTSGQCKGCASGGQ